MGKVVEQGLDHLVGHTSIEKNHSGPVIPYLVTLGYVPRLNRPAVRFWPKATSATIHRPQNNTCGNTHHASFDFTGCRAARLWDNCGLPFPPP